MDNIGDWPYTGACGGRLARRQQALDAIFWRKAARCFGLSGWLAGCIGGRHRLRQPRRRSSRACRPLMGRWCSGSLSGFVKGILPRVDGRPRPEHFPSTHTCPRRGGWYAASRSAVPRLVLRRHSLASSPSGDPSWKKVFPSSNFQRRTPAYDGPGGPARSSIRPRISRSTTPATTPSSGSTLNGFMLEAVCHEDAVGG
jgi:hypothetical protein